MAPEPHFDALIHAPQRLRICAMLSQATGIEFREVQERTGLSKSALSKHLSQLADAGYLSEEPFVFKGRSRLMLSLTPAGREAYLGHKEALQQLLEDEPEHQDQNRRQR
ncbi:transcriptional regulator [Nesterenkonia sp. CF4.4]|uniref:transcriptional regulator n=1 Tax=Nesterenkonia sp. CF4.4 TaxID=3373079 RepID=UPI003EE677D9